MNSENLNFYWVSDRNLDDDFKLQIEDLNRKTFPGNLVENRYIFNLKQSDPRRLLLMYGKELIGHLLVVKRKVKLDGKTINILYLGEVIIKEEYRNRGFGRSILLKFQERKFKADVALLLCEEKNLDFYLKLGWLKLD